MTTTTEKYIQKAVAAAKEELAGVHFNNVSVSMNTQSDGATLALVRALESQAEANKKNSEAMLQVANALKPIDIVGIKIIDNNSVSVGDSSYDYED